MRRLASLFALLWLGLALLLVAGAARAGTPVSLSNTWSGRVNFVGTVATMRTGDNVQAPCGVTAPTDVLTATLAGIPANATILGARLYWAGSGGSADDRVNFEGAEVVAQRSFTTATDIAGLNYFSGVADVTAQVAAKARDGNDGNGTYRFSGLAIDAGGIYCTRAGVLGGFSLMVMYSHPTEPYRMMNLYEGFQFYRNSSMSLTMNNFLMPSKFNKTSARLGTVTWEGSDASGDRNEYVTFNGVELSTKMNPNDRFNPSGRQFNSTSNVSGNQASWGIDFDAWDIQNHDNEKPLDPDATSVTTTYQAGADLVLLGAQVVAVPNILGADLKIAMVRAGDLQVGAKARYTLTVSNLGPNQQNGPITVTDTMPAGFTQPVGSGSGWACSTSGQVVTCKYAGALPAEGSLPPITVTANITAAGTYTNTAAVSATGVDNVSNNNTASDTATTIASVQGAYVFTDAACLPGVAFGTDGQCSLYNNTLVAGQAGAIFVTAIDSAGKPIAPSATAKNVSFDFALGCVKPARNAGIQASYAGINLTVCSPAGSLPAPTDWKAAALLFPANKPSALLTTGKDPMFNYLDVGSVVLYLRDGNGLVASSQQFVVMPAFLDFQRIARARGNLANPESTGASGPGFAMAGEDFSIAIRACALAVDTAGNATCGATLPNFGNEGQGVMVVQDASARPGQPALVPGTLGAPVNGVFIGTGFHYDEVGVIKLTPQLLSGDYLGAGPVAGIQRSVGRFYPAYFTTEIASAFACLKKMCPTTVVTDLMRGGVYSRQKFMVTVKAFNTRDGLLDNYAFPYASDIVLTLVTSPGGAGLVPASAGVFDLPRITADKVASPTKLAATFTLPVGYSNASPHASNISAPLPFFVRAMSTEALAGSTETISSLRAANSSEQGITAVAGRLQLSNAFGSELLKLPVPMKAQYWSGTAWENNTNDTESIDWLANFSQCVKGLRDASGACALTALRLMPLQPGTTSVALKDGAGTAWLAPTGAGQLGSGYMEMIAGKDPVTGKDTRPWLPSTLSRVTFGIYQSQLIYIREVY
jgi:uncharacterized repeat protein (TIGR01451 family)